MQLSLVAGFDSEVETERSGSISNIYSSQKFDGQEVTEEPARREAWLDPGSTVVWVKVDKLLMV